MGVISIVHGIYKATYNWELVDKYYFTFGLMNGGYIELVFMGFINQRSHHWGEKPPCIKQEGYAPSIIGITTIPGST